jgi:hypothetical protein
MDPEGFYRVQKRQTRTCILSHVNSVSILPSTFFKIYLNIILPSTIRSSTWTHFFRFSGKNLYVSFSPLPSHPSRFNHSDSKLWSSSLCNFLSPVINSSLLGPQSKPRSLLLYYHNRKYGNWRYPSLEELNSHDSVVRATFVKTSWTTWRGM